MRKNRTALIGALLLPAGVALALAANGRNEDRKESGDDGEKPVVVVTWDYALPPIHRLAPAPGPDLRGNC